MSLAKILLIIGVCTGVCHAQNDKTPALIWSSSRPLSDLSQPFAGETVDKKIFTDDYLKPLTANNKHSMVVFLQDKLSVEDFTKHADVYSLNSDGGAFKNVKTAMDEQYSVHLPAVTSPKAAVDELASRFAGTVIRVDNPDALAIQDLVKDQSYLILVTLKPISTQDEYASFQANDAMIGQCLHHLTKRGVDFTAIYTAESSSQLSSAEHHGSRQLMAAGDEAATQGNGTLWANEHLMLLLRTVNLTIELQQKDTKAQRFNMSFPYTEQTSTNATLGENNTAIHLVMTLNSSEKGILEISMIVGASYHNTMWNSRNGTLTFKPPAADQKFAINNMTINYQMESFHGWCFHCTKLSAKPVMRGYNNTVPDTTLRVQLIFDKFQIQPSFNKTEWNFSTNTTFSRNVWDCVEFFTIPIWTGIIVTFIIITILFYGITMLANITTMDRFDDPKGKTITVTVNE